MLATLTLLLLHAFSAERTAEPSGELRIEISAPDARGPLYLAGTFNQWNPGAAAWRLKQIVPANSEAINQQPTTWVIEVAKEKLSHSPIEFKITRGSWQTVEVNADLSDIDNRTLTAEDLLSPLKLKVAAWADDRSETGAEKGTVTGKLDVFDFASKRLKNSRKIRVWLPPGYSDTANAERSYPVLYMHDGQNLFDKRTSFMGAEWKADETATKLIQSKKIPPFIIVGIDNTGARSAEYNPPFTYQGDVANIGDRYLDFILSELMPAIAVRYRIATGPENTSLGGSSYGGNITLYALLRHPEVFGQVIVESPAILAFGGALLDRCLANYNWPQRMFVACGTRESKNERVQKNYIRSIEALRRTFAKQKIPATRVKLIEEDGALHNETAWARRLPAALEFLFGKKAPDEG
ncbi:MAG: alpha/beta hydrolase [Planctomycetes bacterium]|nr:alpha/beta hydrolase [Planctomycetota bacterium]